MTQRVRRKNRMRRQQWWQDWLAENTTDGRSLTNTQQAMEAKGFFRWLQLSRLWERQGLIARGSGLGAAMSSLYKRAPDALYTAPPMLGMVPRE